MKGRNLLKVGVLSTLGFLAGANASAQMKESIATNIGGTRFVITAPSAISGIKKINYATWGAPASPTLSGKFIEKAYDTLGAAPLINSATFHDLTGKFALIYRGGGYTFSQKVNYCIAKGAIGVIIVNNVPGDPVGMAPTPTGSTVAVPVLMVSDVDGQAISDQIKASVPVTLTLGTWNTGGANDLGILMAYQNKPHALNMPYSQLKGAGNPEPYKQYIGGAVANYGTNAATGISVTDSIFWTPTAGSSTYVDVKSYSIPSLTVADSIRFGFGTAGYDLPAPTGTGKYEHKLRIAGSGVDDFPQDNAGSYIQNITDSIYCRGNYDYVNNRPSISIGIQPALTAPTNYIFGTPYYIKNGGYAARKAQFNLSVNTVPTLDGVATCTVTLLKWVDGTAGTGSLDSFIQAGELTPVGYNVKDFTTADSSGATITLNIRDLSSATKPVKLESNSWYLLMVEVPNTSAIPVFFGMDKSHNAFSRSYAQYKAMGSPAGAGISDNSVAAFFADLGTFNTTSTNSMATYPFAASATVPSNTFNVDSIFYDKFDQIPAMALMLSKDTVSLGINDPVKSSIASSNIYPNPATKGVLTVDVAFTERNDKIVYRLYDMTGRTVFVETHTNVLNDKFNINTTQYTSGNYMLMIITDNGSEARKVTIQN